MYCHTRQFNKAPQPIAAEVDNRGNTLSDTSSHSVNPIVGKIISTVCSFEAMRGDKDNFDESVSSSGDLVVFSAGIAPLTGRSGFGISASDSGIPEVCVGKTRKNLWREVN